MPLQKLTFKPGVNRENTRYTNEGGWFDMSCVRFRSGTPERIGGWTRLTSAVFLGVARMLHNWTTIAGENLLAVGTNLKFYVERGAVLSDITPIREAFTGLTNPFTTGAAGSSTVTVTIVNHGAITGDFVTFSGSAAVDGILAATLNAEFQVTYVSSSVFTITATPCTAGGVTGGGAAVAAAFQVTTGPETAVVGTGYGVGGYGVDGYGDAASGAGIVTSGLRQWSSENFGQDLVISIRGGGLYYWTTTGVAIGVALATRAVDISTIAGASDTPLYADNVLVTDDVHVVVFGTNSVLDTTYDPMLVRWCAQGNPANWTPAATNTAGEQRLTVGSGLYAVKRMRQENLIWTDAALVSMQFVGPPVVFSFTTLATNVSIASANAVGVAGNAAYWMGKDKFFVYNGQVQTLPCDVRKYVFGDLNISQLGQVYAGESNEFNEITWFYCSAASEVPDRYVTFNYVENLWTFGEMTRTAWLDSPLRPKPIATGIDGRLYYHEDGLDDNSTSPAQGVVSFLESADFDLGEGDRFASVQRIIPDVDFTGSTAATPAVTLTLKGRDVPGSQFLQAVEAPVTQGALGTVSPVFTAQATPMATVQAASVTFTPFTDQKWIRIRARQLSFRVDCSALGVSWQLGTPRLDIRQDGRR